ncbi:MAG TPA: hypothetical protein VGH90_10885 [Chthoniobacteraceae bacterium]|jgi:hypothetical protein
MLTSEHHSGHSADVDMELRVNGAVLSIGQMGPDFLLMDSLVDHPPCDATIVLRVDGVERQWRVRLPEGLSAEVERVKIANPLVA